MLKQGDGKQYLVTWEDGKAIPARTEWSIHIQIYKMTEDEFKEYQAKVKEVFGVTI